jgi:hypothetical protein
MKREGHARQTLPLKSGWSDNLYAILENDERKIQNKNPSFKILKEWKNKILQLLQKPEASTQ